MKLNQIVKHVPLLEQSSSTMELLSALDDHMHDAAIEYDRQNGKDVKRSDSWEQLFLKSKPWTELEGDGKEQVFEDVIRIIKTKGMPLNIRQLNIMRDAFGGTHNSLYSLKRDIKETALRVEFLHENDFLPQSDWVRNDNNAIQLINRDVVQLMTYYKCCAELIMWLDQFMYVFLDNSPMFDETDRAIARACFKQLGISITQTRD